MIDTRHIRHWNTSVFSANVRLIVIICVIVCPQLGQAWHSSVGSSGISGGVSLFAITHGCPGKCGFLHANRQAYLFAPVHRDGEPVTALTADQQRALVMLADAGPRGVADSLLVDVHGFSLAELAEMVHACLATVTQESARAGGRTVTVVRMRITDAGAASFGRTLTGASGGIVALATIRAGLRWPHAAHPEHP